MAPSPGLQFWLMGFWNLEQLPTAGARQSPLLAPAFATPEESQKNLARAKSLAVGYVPQSKHVCPINSLLLCKLWESQVVWWVSHRSSVFGGSSCC